MIWQHPVMKMNTCLLIRAASLTLCTLLRSRRCLPSVECCWPSTQRFLCLVQICTRSCSAPRRSSLQEIPGKHVWALWFSFQVCGVHRWDPQEMSPLFKLGQFLMGKYIFLLCILVSCYSVKLAVEAVKHSICQIQKWIFRSKIISLALNSEKPIQKIKAASLCNSWKNDLDRRK